MHLLLKTTILQMFLHTPSTNEYMIYLTFDSFSVSAGLSIWTRELQATKKYEN